MYGVCIWYHSAPERRRLFKSFFTTDKDLSILHGQYNVCWWPGDSMSQGISSHSMDPGFMKYSGLSSGVSSNLNWFQQMNTNHISSMLIIPSYSSNINNWCPNSVYDVYRTDFVQPLHRAGPLMPFIYYTTYNLCIIYSNVGRKNWWTSVGRTDRRDKYFRYLDGYVQLYIIPDGWYLI